MSRFYDEGAPAGTTGAAQPTLGSPSPGTEGASPAAGSEAAAGAEAGKELSIDEKYAALEAKHKALATAHEEKTKAFDRSQSELGTLRKTFKNIGADPEAFRNRFNEQFPVPTKAEPPVFDKLFDGSMTPAQAAASFQGALKQQVDQIKAELFGQLRGPLETVQETTLANRYKDWDDLADARETNAVQIKLNQVPMAEVAHLVTQARRIPDMLNDYKKVVESEIMETLEKKYAGYVPPGGGSSRPRAKKPEGTLEFDKVLDQL